MMTDLWFRNADRAMAVCAAEGVSRITWTRQHLARSKMDGILFVRQFYMHTAVRPKIMLIGIQGSAEYTMFSKLTEPIAVYPTWSGKNDSWDDLRAMIDNPVGEDMKRCSAGNLPPTLRPVYGQKHRIVIHNNPNPQQGVGKQFFLELARWQNDYPEVELFLNGSKSFSTMFGLKFRACDLGLSDLGDRNLEMILPNGLTVDLGAKTKTATTITQGERLMQNEDWVKLVGLTAPEVVRDQNKRFTLRIRSGKWAAKHWGDNLRFFRESYNVPPDLIDVPEESFYPPESKRIVLRPKQFSLAEADKVLCNRCRIQVGCRFFRADSICSVMGSEMNELEKFFQSRNAGLIVDGLSQLVKLQARRLETTMTNEAAGTEVNPEVDKQINSLFANGVKLAKLVDPTLAGPGTKVQVNVGTGGSAQVVANSNPKQMMAGIVEALELQGIPREKITPEMVSSVLKGMTGNTEQQAIEAAAVKFSDLLGGNQSGPIAHPVIMNKEDYDRQVLEGQLVPVKKTGRD